MSEIDRTCADRILESNDAVFGLIYEIKNKETDMRYVGQTVSHRKNKAKFRPFGTIGRFKDHISEATNNTKKKQCKYLNNAIRKYGVDAFEVVTIETCRISELDEREQYYIKSHNTLFPNGYNLTHGGKKTIMVEHCLMHDSLKTPQKRGGCVSRNEITRAKMSMRAKELVTDTFRATKSISAKKQHMVSKLERYKDCKIDITEIDKYIRTKGKRIIVTINHIRTEFTSKHENMDQIKERAITFIKQLYDATLSNCGEPVKPE